MLDRQQSYNISQAIQGQNLAVYACRRFLGLNGLRMKCLWLYGREVQTKGLG